MNYKVEFDSTTRKLSINKNKNSVPKGFWGHNIHGINLIVGKNGSGKSTILDLLGLESSERKSLLSNSDSDIWFALYRYEDGYFLEGNNLNSISNLYNYQNENNHIINIKDGKNDGGFVQVEVVDNSDARKTVFLYDKTISPYLDWYEKNSGEKSFLRNDRGEITHVFQRNYLNKLRLIDIYNNLKEGFTELDEKFAAKNVEAIISRRNDFTEIEKGNKKKFEINLYKGHWNLICKKEFKIWGKREEIDQEEINQGYSTKEKFIIGFFEESIYYATMQIKDDYSKEISIKFLEYCENNKPLDTYESRVDFLIGALNLIHKIRKERNQNFKSLIEKFPFENLKDLFEKIDIYYFKSFTEILIPVDSSANINEFLDFIDNTESYRSEYPIEVRFNKLSMGEFQFIKHYTNLKSVIHQINYDSIIENMIILLDEPDSNFHPEWSRQYIFNLVDLLNKIEVKDGFKFQVIIATHSPFMVSDIPRDYINCINLIEKNGSIERLIKKADFGLMSNYYDLIKNNFFMSYPIGEYAKKIFENITKEIDGLESYNQKTIDKIRALINLIDDPLISRKLIAYLDDKVNELQIDQYDTEYNELLKEKQELEKKKKEIELQLDNYKSNSRKRDDF